MNAVAERLLMLATDPILRIPERRLRTSEPGRILRYALGDQAYEAMVARLGQEPDNFLGMGLHGVVFSLPDGRALKLSDNADLRAALTLVAAAPDRLSEKR